jgi:intein-encoded DNA endonuclease-like protein
LTDQLHWPPLKEDLERLYLAEKLSAAKIANVYGLHYASPKTAESTILQHLKKNGIQRRDRADHIRKITKEMVDDWIHRYQQGESLKQIAGGNVDPVSVWNHLRARGIELRGKVQAQIASVTMHQKAPFSGDALERAYVIGLRFGDLDVVRHGRAVRARVSTTHPAMIELFVDLFSKYGYIRRYAVPSNLTGFEWCLECDLDESFSFLLEPEAEIEEMIKSETLFFAFLAGFFDADGSVYYHKKGGGGSFEFTMTNMNERILRTISERLARAGFSPALRLAQQVPDRGVKNGKSFIWKLSLWRCAEVAAVLRLIPIRHREKKAKRELALALPFRASRENRKLLIIGWDSLKKSIIAERDACVREAAALVTLFPNKGRNTTRT